jgi:hypothetical protein
MFHSTTGFTPKLRAPAPSGRCRHDLLGLLFGATIVLLFPETAVAQGVDLTWNDCPPTGASSKTFGCASPSNENYRLIVQFRSPVTLPNFVRIDAVLELVNETAGPLAPFWHYETGACNRAPISGVTMSDDISLAATCLNLGYADPWASGSGGTEDFFYVPDSPTPGHGRFILTDTAVSPVQIDAFVSYYAFHLTFNNRNRLVCTGCSQPVALKLVSLRLSSNDGSPAVLLAGPDLRGDCVLINGANATTCFQACQSGPEICDGIDNDCNLAVDDILSYRDADGDGYGTHAQSSAGCPIPPGYVSNDDDCDDTRAWVHPGAEDFCNGLDDDCDGVRDEGTVAQGVVGWWKAEGNTNDAVGNNHGTPQNGVAFTAGKVGQAFSLDGSDDYVGSIGTASTFSFIQNTGVFTIEGWIKLDDPNTLREQAIIANTPTTAEKGHYFTWNNSAGQQQLDLLLLKGQAGIPVIAATSPNHVITDSDWHHVAATGNGTGITFYVDGVAFPVGGVMGSKSTGNSTRAIDIGRCAPSSCLFAGGIDELAIYNRALSASEIGAIHDAGSGGRCAVVSVVEPPLAESTLELTGPRPNPSSHGADIEFRLPMGSMVRVLVTDVAGRQVSSLAENREMPAGSHRLRWDGRDRSGRTVRPGVYVIQVSVGDRTTARKLVVVR